MASEQNGNVKQQIGHCGIWCGGCLGGNGTVKDQTMLYQDTVEKSRAAIEEWDFDPGDGSLKIGNEELKIKRNLTGFLNFKASTYAMHGEVRECRAFEGKIFRK